jgi:hypothetical protein
LRLARGRGLDRTRSVGRQVYNLKQISNLNVQVLAELIDHLQLNARRALVVEPVQRVLVDPGIPRDLSYFLFALTQDSGQVAFDHSGSVSKKYLQ